MNSHGLDFISFKVICLVSSFELVCYAAATIFLVLLEYDAAYTAIMLLPSGDLSCGEMSDVEHCKLYGKTGRGDFGIQAISESNTNC